MFTPYKQLMNFIYNDKNYSAATAVEIVKAIQQDLEGYSSLPGSIRDFLDWSLAQFSDRIHGRELLISPHLPEETIALNYLYLLDEYHIGTFSEGVRKDIELE